MKSRTFSLARRGAVLETALVATALVGLFVFVFKPRVLDGDSKRADKSTESSARLEGATAEALAAAEREKLAALERLRALEAQAGSAAAGVVKIGEANTLAPESPSRDFIGREIPAVLAKLPSADLAALLEAERRRVAVMSGDLKSADALYQREVAEAGRLRDEVKLALARADAAAAEAAQAKIALAGEQAERRRVDSELAEVAAVRLALERRDRWQRLGLYVLGVLALVVWLSGVSPMKIGRAMADIRSGVDPATAMDTVLPEWMQGVAKWSRVRATKKARRDAADQLPVSTGDRLGEPG